MPELEPLSRSLEIQSMNPKAKTIQELKVQRHRKKLVQLRSSIAELVQEQRFHPESVILFGSYARGDFNGFSDIDLIVVDRSRDQAVRLAAVLQEQGLADDVLTFDMEQWSQKQVSKSAFWKSVREEYITLYEHA
ncbi:MAG TPA: hypothetical protein DIT94_12285 [Deltaproteobacteria bacterium]|nr:hypothetical protein [Deltaproteobacteria bacterium]